MKLVGKLLIAASAVAVFSGSAMAADLYVPPKAAPIMPVASTNWDGLYVGAHVGYGWESLATPTAVTGNGFTAGGQLGYNFHLSDQIVAGIEGNIDWANETGTAVPGTYTINWDGSVRGRLGVDMGQWLPYVEAGVAFANIADSSASTSPEVRTGYTLGAGVEVMLADNLSANVEYRYSNYGAGSGSAVSDNAILVGLNYHF
jgi:outer membrane autotransporter protein